MVEHARYRDLAKENRVRLEVLRAPRGAIYDRHGDLLVDSGPSFTILFQPFPAESAHRTRQVQSTEWLARVADLIEGDTLEMRLFARPALVRHLTAAGFTDIRFWGEPYLAHGIYWSSPLSLPITARRPV